MSDETHDSTAAAPTRETVPQAIGPNAGEADAAATQQTADVLEAFHANAAERAALFVNPEE